MPQAKHAYTTPAYKPRLPASLTPQARKLVDDAMSAHWRALEGLIAFLDAAEGDTDMEDKHDGREPDVDDEPSLGSPECVGYIPADGPGGGEFSQTRWAVGTAEDLEVECEDEGADADVIAE